MIDAVLKPAVSFIAEMIESVLRTEIENASYSKASLFFLPKTIKLFLFRCSQKRIGQMKCSRVLLHLFLFASNPVRSPSKKTRKLDKSGAWASPVLFR